MLRTAAECTVYTIPYTYTTKRIVFRSRGVRARMHVCVSRKIFFNTGKFCTVSRYLTPRQKPRVPSSAILRFPICGGMYIAHQSGDTHRESSDMIVIESETPHRRGARENARLSKSRKKLPRFYRGCYRRNVNLAARPDWEITKNFDAARQHASVITHGTRVLVGVISVPNFSPGR